MHTLKLSLVALSLCFGADLKADLEWSWDKVNFVKCENVNFNTLKHTWEAYFTVQGKQVEVVVDRQYENGSEDENVLVLTGELELNADPNGVVTGVTIRSSKKSSHKGYMHVVGLLNTPEKFGNSISRSGAGVLVYENKDRSVTIDFSSCAIERDRNRELK